MEILAVLGTVVVFLWFAVCLAWFLSTLVRHMNVPGEWSHSMLLEPRDLWVGMYWDSKPREFRVYLCLTPGVVFKFVRHDFETIYQPETIPSEVLPKTAELNSDHQIDCDCPGCIGEFEGDSAVGKFPRRVGWD